MVKLLSEAMRSMDLPVYFCVHIIHETSLLLKSFINIKFINNFNFNKKHFHLKTVAKVTFRFM